MAVLPRRISDEEKEIMALRPAGHGNSFISFAGRLRPSDKKQFIIITMGNADYAHRFDEPERLAEWAGKTW